MNVMFPESFTAEYEEMMAFLEPDYLVVQIINGQPYRMSEPTRHIEEAWAEMYRFEEAHPENGYLTFTLTEYEEWVTGR